MAQQRHDSEYRPSPEALLEAARREDRRIGKLRIFVGAAAGVGKTYEMLLQAQARKKDGYDVVVAPSLRMPMVYSGLPIRRIGHPARY